jgi:nitrile hydratase
MNGVHDLGGMDGFGPVTREANEPVFHAPWERRVFGMLLATMGQGIYNLDELRHGIERMSPAHYLGSTYYEHWLNGLERVLGEKGRLSAREIEARVREIAAGAPPPSGGNPELAAALAGALGTGASTARGDGKPRFRRGARVRVRKMNPLGHTRCPRYVRGAAGEIERIHGRHVFPDTHAHGGGERPQVLYTVGFDAAELWGAEAQGRGRVYVDLWESYLETVGAKRAKPAPKRSKATRRKPAARRARKSR